MAIAMANVMRAAPAEVDPGQLPYLIQLLDDDSESVREAVANRLFAFGGLLGDELARQGILLRAHQDRIVSDIFRERGREWIETNWLGWRDLDDEDDRLEEGLRLTSWFVNDFRCDSNRVSNLLDALADRCRERSADRHVIALSEYLFCSGRFRGNRRDYYGPQNSDLAWVLESGTGNPISLASIFILVGRRCGLAIDGCNYPGHFLTRFVSGREILLVDCFNRGKVIMGNDLIEHQPFASREVTDAVETPATTEMILRRVLRNLDTAYSRLGNREDQRLVRRLLQRMVG